MLIRDRIFAKLEELDMTQKEFSRRTGIPESTVSDWRKEGEALEELDEHLFRG